MTEKPQNLSSDAIDKTGEFFSVGPPLHAVKLDMHNRMKECLVLLGRLEKAVVRPPLMKLGDAEINRLRLALEDAGLMGESAYQTAAQ